MRIPEMIFEGSNDLMQHYLQQLFQMVALMFEFSDSQTFISTALPGEAESIISGELTEAIHQAANDKNGFDFDGEPVCRACQLALNSNSLDESSMEKKLHNPYAHSCLSSPFHN